MDARFLVLDLGIEIIEEKDEEPEAADAVGVPEGPEGGVGDAAGGTFSVTRDAVAVPGAIVSGKVTFSDGEKALWMIDEYGRPGRDG